MNSLKKGKGVRPLNFEGVPGSGGRGPTFTSCPRTETHERFQNLKEK